MTYEELVNKIKAKERVLSKDIPGVWFFYLLQDGIIPTISYRKKVYEINFIPSEPVSSGLFIVDDQTCKTGAEAMEMFQTIARGVVDGLHLFITFDEEYYAIKLEELESNE